MLAGLLGAACFAAEDVALQHQIGCVHALWHCLAAYAVASSRELLRCEAGALEPCRPLRPAVVSHLRLPAGQDRAKLCPATERRKAE